MPKLYIKVTAKKIQGNPNENLVEHLKPKRKFISTKVRRNRKTEIKNTFNLNRRVRKIRGKIKINSLFVSENNSMI